MLCGLRIFAASLALLFVVEVGSSKGQTGGANQTPMPQAVTAEKVPIQSGSATANPMQIALLKWYKADLTTNFAVGNEP